MNIHDIIRAFSYPLNNYLLFKEDHIPHSWLLVDTVTALAHCILCNFQITGDICVQGKKNVISAFWIKLCEGSNLASTLCAE
jgi:hypothetical protein